MQEVGRGVKVSDHPPVRGVWRTLSSVAAVAELAASGDGAVVAVTRDLSGPFLAPVLHQLAAVVSTVGTPSSHLAILARERGVPCVVSVQLAADAPADGAEVEVDCSGADGVVRA